MMGPAQRILLTPVSEDEGLSKVKVVVRVRPFLSSELANNKSVIQIDQENEGQLYLKDPRRNDGTLQFSFDRCYTSDSSQAQIFSQEIEPYLSNLFKGINTTIFCTGMTGAGKTHTMQGTKEDPGLIPRTINSVINLLDQFQSSTLKLNQDSHKLINQSSSSSSSSSSPSTIHLSYFEIYNEKVYDLIEPKDQECAVREDLNRKIVVAGLSETLIHSFSDFNHLYELGLKNRRTAATKLNHVSSRSHALLMLKVKTRERTAPFRNVEAKLFLIDLAGNEDNRKTDNKGARMTESVNINSSLLALAKVVQALNDGDKRIPYRESKLTRLLQDSLGGNSFGVMIANVAPGITHFLNTYHTLNFATKSRQVVNNLQINSLLETEKVSSSNSPSISNNHTSSSSTQNTTVDSATDDRRQMLDKWKESKSKASNGSSMSTSIKQIDSAATIELKNELAKLQREHQQHKEQKQAQAKINESYLQRIAQLEKKLSQHSHRPQPTLVQSLPVATTSSSSSFNPVNATPCTKTKMIHQRIARAKGLEVVAPDEALQIYSEMLSQLKTFGSDYAQVIVKVQSRIDKILASTIESNQDKVENSNPTSKLQSRAGPTIREKPKTNGVNTQTNTGVINKNNVKATDKTSPVVRTLFTDKENCSNVRSGINGKQTSPAIKPTLDAPAYRKRKSDEMTSSNDDADEEFVAHEDESDEEIEESPLRRPNKKRKIASPQSDIESQIAKARSAIAQELALVEFPSQQEIENILQILNSGDAKAIRNLHGIGKVRADQIVERASHTPFSSLEELVHAGLGIRLIVTFVRRNIVEAIYFSKTANAVGASATKPIILEPMEV